MRLSHTRQWRRVSARSSRMCRNDSAGHPNANPVRGRPVPRQAIAGRWRGRGRDSISETEAPKSLPHRELSVAIRATALIFCSTEQISSRFAGWRVQPQLQKYSCSLLTQISSLIRAVLSQERGVAHVINAGGDAVDAGGALDESCCCGRRSRVVLTPRRRRQVCEKK